MFLSCSLGSILLLLAQTSARPANLWDINILKGPSPPPNEGPPLSANAVRDPSKLRYEIIGIGGAYAFWCLVTLILIFCVGKRLRRRAQTSNRTLSMEMIRPTLPTLPSSQVRMDIPPGPRSPGKMNSLKSWASGGKTHSYKQSDVSVSTIDEKTVELDRARNMDEMAKLYAAVIAHDEEKSIQARSSGHTSPRSPQFLPPNTTAGLSHAVQTAPTPPLSPQYPPEFQHLRYHAGPPQPQTQSSGYPSGRPTLDEISRSTDTSRTSSHQIKASPLSFISSSNHARTGSNQSGKARPGRISVRGLPISQPIGSADLTESSVYSDEMPLSPRLYNPGPPPPAPGQQRVALSAPREMEKPARQTPANFSLRSVAPTNSSNNSLPFRQMYQESMKSAPPTKTTFLDRKESNLPIHPQTGVPATPYSPYTPFTPMTPITPRRLVTKEEMKRNRKKEGLKVLSEDDMVASEEDMWGEM